MKTTRSLAGQKQVSKHLKQNCFLSQAILATIVFGVFQITLICCAFALGCTAQPCVVVTLLPSGFLIVYLFVITFLLMRFRIAGALSIPLIAMYFLGLSYVQCVLDLTYLYGITLNLKSNSFVDDLYKWASATVKDGEIAGAIDSPLLVKNWEGVFAPRLPHIHIVVQPGGIQIDGRTPLVVYIGRLGIAYFTSPDYPEKLFQRILSAHISPDVRVVI